MAKKNSINLKDVPTNDLMDFSGICEPLIKYIRCTWDWKGFKPRGYEKYKAEYSDYDKDERAVKWAAKFKGINSGTASSFGFHVQTARHHVCYDDTSQGRDPLHVLMSSCVGFGLIVGDERAKRQQAKNIKEHNEQIEKYCQAAQQAKERALTTSATDPEEKIRILEQALEKMPGFDTLKIREIFWNGLL